MIWQESLSVLLFLLRILFLVLLYGFLVTLAWLVWRELKQGSAISQGAQAPAHGPRLTVVQSGDSGYAEGRVFNLDTITTLGRDLSNEIVISDSYTSSRHARIELQSDERFWIVDLGSSNGTLLNGQSLRPNTPVPLDRGDVLSIGTVELQMG
jgi:pSer/pThr/pTyr-binding forkhead associated (FHA) protein